MAESNALRTRGFRKKNNTCTVTSLPPSKKAIGFKWIYKIKYNADGYLKRYKVCLVAKRHMQQEGIDYLDTFSSVAKLTTVKVVLALATLQGWSLHQLDVNNAFLHRDLIEEVYMKHPSGFPIPNSNTFEPLAFKLSKSLYGLKQASCQWYAKLSSALLKERFSQSYSDSTLFVNTHG